MESDKHSLGIATQDALMVIAGASGTASRDLRPGLSLTADLGLDDVGLALVADYLQRIAYRMRRSASPSPLDAESLRDALVWQALATMFAQAGHVLEADDIRTHVAAALGRLRGYDTGSG
jgi:hypothetical protein